jgi:DNA-binding SARP family transcriptional activator/predicted ATPase
MQRDAFLPTHAVRRAWLLGGLRVEHASKPLNVPRGKPWQLLARLLVETGSPLTREQLIDGLWPEARPERAGRYLSNALYRLRQALGEGWLETGEGRVAVRAAPDLWMDVNEFEASAKSASPAAWARAVALYTGDLLPEVYDDWVLTPRLALRETYLAVLRRAGAEAEASGRWTEAVAFYRRLVAADPYSDTALQGVMRCLASAGRITAALEAFSTFAKNLGDELGLAPSADTQALAARLRVELETAAAERERPSPTFVGRRSERARLIACLDRARAGSGGLIVVMGEAGIGKTRLLNELAEAARWRGWLAALGQADEFQQFGPDEPLRQALREALPMPRWQQLDRLLLPAWLTVLRRWLPAPNAAAPGPDPGQYGPSDLPQALRQCLGALQTIAPHLFLLDDVQWAEPGMWRLLDDLRASLRSMSIVVVLAGRLDELRAQPLAWKRVIEWDQHGETVLALSGLSPDDLHALVQRQAGRSLSVAQLAALSAATGGNPLLALELAQVDDLEQLVVDRPSVAALARRWLDALSGPARRALGACAAIGFEFKYSVWEHVLAAEGWPAETLPALGGELERAGLLNLTTAGYRFRHDTLRAVAYRDTPDAERTRWHQLILAVLEAQPAGPIECLHHAVQAGDAAAIAQHARQAGDRALAGYAYRAAADYYRQALEALPSHPSPARFEALSGRITALRVLADRPALEDEVPALRALADALDNPALQAEAALQDARFRWQVADYTQARAAASWGLARAVDDHQRAELYGELGRIARDMGDYPAADGWLQQALAAHRTLGDTAGIATVTDLLGIVAQRQGRAQAAIAFHTEAGRLFHQLADLRSESHSAINLGIAHQAAGDYAQAQLAFERGAVFGHKLGDSRAEAAALNNVAGLAGMLGDHERALEAQGRALDLARAAGNRQFVAMLLNSAGITHAALGHLDEALTNQREALELNHALGRPRGEGYCFQAMGEALLQSGRFAEAETALEEAERLRLQLDEPDNLMVTRAYLALAHLGQDRTASAGAALEAALGALDEERNNPEDRRDVHFCAYRVLVAGDALKAALAHLCAAEAAVQAISATLPLDDRDRFWQRVPQNRRVRDALAAHSRTITPRLVRAGVPLGRALTPDDYVSIAWTISAPGDELIGAKDERRRHVLRRLLAEAEAQGGAPTDGDLGSAVGVSRRTIERDMAALQAAGRAPSTRRRRAA